MKARDFEVFIDRHEISALEEWWKRIETLITQADTIVFVLSPDSVGSKFALKEIDFAASLNKRFAPVVCRRVDNEAVPEALAKLNYIFFDDGAWIPERSATGLREADLHILSELGKQRLERRLEAEAFTGREVGGEDDLLDFLVGCPVDIEVARQPSA